MDGDGEVNLKLKSLKSSGTFDFVDAPEMSDSSPVLFFGWGGGDVIIHLSASLRQNHSYLLSYIMGHICYHKSHIFFVSQPKYMLWVLKRTFSMRRFF